MKISGSGKIDVNTHWKSGFHRLGDLGEATGFEKPIGKWNRIYYHLKFIPWFKRSNAS
ncbi:hypothetical protein [Mariniphaga sediminis]|uniref:hypothetical protein n=1 Tax=Mariniphaga sediminis TaxID=1628158 RepID=UPI0035620B1F